MVAIDPTSQAVQSQQELSLSGLKSPLQGVNYSNMVGLEQKNSPSLVIEVQKALKNKGLYEGELDGKVGALTTAAIKNYQNSISELKSDGIVGPRTAASLLGLPLPPRPIRQLGPLALEPRNIPDYRSINYNTRGASITDASFRYDISAEKTQSHEEGLRILGIDPYSLKRDRNGNLLTRGATSSQGLSVFASGGVIGGGFGQTGLQGVDKGLLQAVAGVNQQSFYKTGKGMVLTGAKELGDSRGRKHANGAVSHMTGQKVDINAEPSFNKFLMTNSDFTRTATKFGSVALLHKPSNTVWELEGGANGHWDVRKV